MKPLNVAVLGIGNVGTGLIETYRLNKVKVDGQTNQPFNFKYILVNSIDKLRTIDLKDSILTTDFQDIIQDDSIDVVIELIGGLHPAFDYMKKSIRSWKTCNYCKQSCNCNIWARITPNCFRQ